LGQDRSASFGDVLRDFRLAAGMSQETLAERARMSAGGISVLERGARRAPHRETVKLLADGLALSPTERKVLEDAAARPSQPRRRRAIAPGESLETINHNLPIELTSFIGREADVAQIQNFLGLARIVTFVGPGGVGKTRTALRVAQILVGTVDAGVWFVDLTPIADPVRVAPVVASAVGAPETPNRTPLQLLLAHLSRRQAVIVLDNCEHVLGEAARVVTEIVRSCPGVRILSTSRERLHAAGERVYRLRPLPVADAVVLFLDRAAAVDHRLAVEAGRTAIIADICERLDSLPLAIELAAARTNALSLEALAEKLDQRLSILSDNADGPPSRHRTLRALIDWSYALLPPPAQRPFERLSAFAGGATLATATGVCGEAGSKEEEILDILASLIDKSLVAADFDHEEPRYTMLESTRQFAREQLEHRGDLTETTRRHAVAFDALAAHYDATWSVAPHPAWAELLRADMENWRSALEWALARRQDVRLGQRLVGSLHHAWVTVAVVEARHWLTLARELLEERTPPEIAASLDYAQAKVMQRAGETLLALEFGRPALQSFRDLGDARRAIWAQRLVADALLTLDQLEEALPLLNEALDSAQKLGYRWPVSVLFQSLGRASIMAGDPNAARGYFQSSLATLREIGDTGGAVACAVNLAEAEFHAGDVQTALRLAEEALAQQRRHGRMYEHGMTNVTAYLIALDRYEEAIAHGRDVLRRVRMDQHSVAVAWTIQHLASATLLQAASEMAPMKGRVNAAARVLGFVDARSNALGAPREYTEQQEYDRVLPRLREMLGAEELEREMSAGATLGEDQATEIAVAL
jgi:predicted ATPase